jgi:hypothetical protein
VKKHIMGHFFRQAWIAEDRTGEAMDRGGIAIVQRGERGRLPFLDHGDKLDVTQVVECRL